MLSVGGLWLLYTTGLYPAMHHHPGLHVLVHAHMFLAGYLFTAAMVSVDPMPHRRSFPHRSLVLVLALAAHDILAKYLYAHPPAGVAGCGRRNRRDDHVLRRRRGRRGPDRAGLRPLVPRHPAAHPTPSSHHPGGRSANR